MVRSKIIIKLSALVAVALLTGCTNNNDLKPQSYNYKTFPKNPNYAIIKPSKDKEFSEENLASMIKNLEGRPYVWAEEGPYCFDCSGYFYYMFGTMGVDIPRVAREQIKKGESIAYEDMKFGDLVFFDTTRGKTGKITHVGMYLKDGWFTHASSSHKQITYSNFNTDAYYRGRFMGARRYYEKNGDKYAILQPKMQNTFTQMIASNDDYKPVSVVASNYRSSAKSDIGGEVAYEDLQTGKVENTVQDSYNIKEENIVIKSTEAINNAAIITTDLSAAKKPEITTDTKEATTPMAKSEELPVKKIAKNETKTSNINNGYYVQVGKFKSSPDKNFLNKIKAQGYAYTIMPISENGKLASKILIGPFKNNTEAHGKLNDVKESIVKEAFITKLDS
jgi:cell division septation protein DedD